MSARRSILVVVGLAVRLRARDARCSITAPVDRYIRLSACRSFR